MKVLYCSNTGFSKRYAELIANEIGGECVDISLKSRVSKKEEIVFVGWIFANKIKKLSKLKKYNVKCVLAVGMTPDRETIMKYLLEANKKDLVGRRLFYALGGLDMTKQRGFNKMLLKMVSKKVISENKYDDRQMMEIFKNGGDFVSKENVSELLEYLKN
ncbi:MAG: hypothetical protein J6B60_04550 [Clostridia bacterium]|nr:hypothetical protein [Clostridia bacterium]